MRVFLAQTGTYHIPSFAHSAHPGEFFFREPLTMTARFDPKQAIWLLATGYWLQLESLAPWLISKYKIRVWCLTDSLLFFFFLFLFFLSRSLAFARPHHHLSRFMSRVSTIRNPVGSFLDAQPDYNLFYLVSSS